MRPLSPADLLKAMVLARSRCASEPKPGDKILIFKQPWLGHVLSGNKTLEVRGAAYKSGAYWFGSRGQQQQAKRAQQMTSVRRDLRTRHARTPDPRGEREAVQATCGGAQDGADNLIWNVIG